jgi:hypothetical protein
LGESNLGREDEETPNQNPSSSSTIPLYQNPKTGRKKRLIQRKMKIHKETPPQKPRQQKEFPQREILASLLRKGKFHWREPRSLAEGQTKTQEKKQQIKKNPLENNIQ